MWNYFQEWVSWVHVRTGLSVSLSLSLCLCLSVCMCVSLCQNLSLTRARALSLALLFLASLSLPVSRRRAQHTGVGSKTLNRTEDQDVTGFLSARSAGIRHHVENYWQVLEKLLAKRDIHELRKFVKKIDGLLLKGAYIQELLQVRREAECGIASLATEGGHALGVGEAAAAAGPAAVAAAAVGFRHTHTRSASQPPQSAVDQPPTLEDLSSTLASFFPGTVCVCVSSGRHSTHTHSTHTHDLGCTWHSAQPTYSAKATTSSSPPIQRERERERREREREREEPYRLEYFSSFKSISRRHQYANMHMLCSQKSTNASVYGGVGPHQPTTVGIQNRILRHKSCGARSMGRA